MLVEPLANEELLILRLKKIWGIRWWVLRLLFTADSGRFVCSGGLEAMFRDEVFRITFNYTSVFTAWVEPAALPNTQPLRCSSFSLACTKSTEPYIKVVYGIVVHVCHWWSNAISYKWRATPGSRSQRLGYEVKLVVHGEKSNWQHAIYPFATLGRWKLYVFVEGNV